MAAAPKLFLNARSNRGYLLAPTSGTGSSDAACFDRTFVESAYDVMSAFRDSLAKAIRPESTSTAPVVGLKAGK
jgi:hypothetical protein